jgi:hypothetical protein
MAARRRLLTVLACGCATLAAVSPAAATGGAGTAQLVSGTVQPMLGVSVQADGSVTRIGTVGETITREQRGQNIIVTVVPAR